jgi:hypothetical protein
MGTAIAANLAAAGYQVIAYVRRAEQMGKLAALGLKPTTDITEVYDREFVISMLAGWRIADSAVSIGNKSRACSRIGRGMRSAVSPRTRASATRCVCGRGIIRRVGSDDPYGPGFEGLDAELRSIPQAQALARRLLDAGPKREHAKA